MRKLLVVGAIALAVQAADAAVTFSWNTGSSRVYDSNGSTLLNGDASFNVGCFLQLIYSVNGTIYNAVNSGNGIDPAHASDNIVIATSWVGKGLIGSPDGRFAAASFTHDYGAGSKFFVRVWNAPSSSYGGGATEVATSVPTSALYGDSSLYTTTQSPSPPSSETFTLSGSISTTLTPLPEPASVALFGLGAITLALRRKLRR